MKLIVAMTFFGFALSPHVVPAKEFKANIPDGFVEFENTLGGVFVIEDSLHQKYQELKREMKALADEISRSENKADDAELEMDAVREKIARTEAEIANNKKLISAVDVHKKKQLFNFQFGSKRCLLVNAEKIRIVGWNKPHVSCVMEKSVLSETDETAEKELDAIEIRHRHGTAPEIVGQSQAEFLGAGESTLSAMQQKIHEENSEYFRPFQSIQGKELDIVEFGGLSHKEGNQRNSFEFKRSNGASYASQLTRHANVTVYVPKCNMIAIRGGRKGIDIQSVDASIAILGDGNKDYSARIKISGVTGNLIAHDLVLHEVENVSGSVTIQDTIVSENYSTRFSGDVTIFPRTSSRINLKDIGGDVRLKFTKIDLAIANAKGKVDVENEFGDTVLINDISMAQQPHRIISTSGKIHVVVPAKDAGVVPTTTITECGTIQYVNVQRELFDNSKMTSSRSKPGNVRRSWIGFVQPSDHARFVDLGKRVGVILSGGIKEPSLNLLSRSGRIRLEHTN